MNILVTGGAGYVGTALIPQLLNEGHNVHVLDSLIHGGDKLLPFMRDKKFSFQKGDVRNLEDVKDAARGKDAVIHLAALVGYPVCRKHPKEAEEVNTGGTKNVLEATSKDQLIIFASTGSNYGEVEGICTEETPLNPLSVYGETKTKAEELLQAQKERVITFRFATAFGLSPRLRLDLLINDFAYKAWAERYLVVYEKHFKRTFVHVHDMGRVFVFALGNQDKMRGEVFNVGSDSMNYNKEEICEILKKKMDGLYVHYADVGEDMDKRNYEVSYKKINAIGYDTTIDVEEGIDELIKSFDVLKTESTYSNA